MLDPKTIVRQAPRVAFRGLAEGEGGVLLHLDSAQYHSVNAVGAAIWELAATGPSLESLVRDLRVKVDDAPEDLENDVDEFLGQLAERGLVELEDQAG